MPQTTDLLFYFSDDFDEHMVAEMKALVQRLAESNSWMCGPPEFVDEQEPADTKTDEDIRTVGGVVRLSAIAAGQEPDWGAEQTHFDEVSRVVAALRVLAKALNTEVELQLGGVYVGDIRDGVVGQGVQMGLLDEWTRRLE